MTTQTYSEHTDPVTGELIRTMHAEPPAAAAGVGGHAFQPTHLASPPPKDLAGLRTRKAQLEEHIRFLANEGPTAGAAGVGFQQQLRAVTKAIARLEAEQAAAQ
jgi:hypothetical protein